MNPHVLRGIGQKLPPGYDFMLLMNETDKSLRIRLKFHNMKDRSLLQACDPFSGGHFECEIHGQPQYGTRNDRELLETLLAFVFSRLEKRPLKSE